MAMDLWKRMHLPASLCLCTLAAVWLPARSAVADNVARTEKVVAAFPFANSSEGGRYAALAQAMGDMLTVPLSKSGMLRLVDRDELARVMAEQRLGALGVVNADHKTKAKLGRLLGADYVLTGSVTAFDDKLRINAHLFDVPTTRLARSVEVDATTADLMTPLSRLAAELGKDLHVELPELSEDALDKAPRVNLHFMRGLGHYYAKRYDRAIAELIRTLILDPDHVDARYWNGRAYQEGGEHAHAKVEFDQFLRQFPKHDLAPEVRTRAARCEAEIDKCKSVQDR
jgi:TolB-like protein